VVEIVELVVLVDVTKQPNTLITMSTFRLSSFSMVTVIRFVLTGTFWLILSSKLEMRSVISLATYRISSTVSSSVTIVTIMSLMLLAWFLFLKTNCTESTLLLISSEVLKSIVTVTFSFDLESYPFPFELLRSFISSLDPICPSPKT